MINREIDQFYVTLAISLNSHSFFFKEKRCSHLEKRCTPDGIMTVFS